MRVQKEVSTSNGELANILASRTDRLRKIETSNDEIDASDRRLQELQLYRSRLEQERDRLNRVGVATAALEHLRVTHCPACDQSVENRPPNKERCFLCGQPIAALELGQEAAMRRVDFEREQISAEIKEAVELIETLKADRQSKIEERGSFEGELRRIEHTLRPFQAEASGVFPEEVSLIDQAIGSRNEKLEALRRLNRPLQLREELSREIDALQSRSKELESLLAQHEEKAEFEAASDRLEMGFNTYMNAISRVDETSWMKNGQIRVRITDRNTRFLIGNRPAQSQLGGRLTIYFLFAYQYALLNLSRFPECHYPGLTVLDLFPELVDGIAIRDRLALVLKPFVDLSKDPQIEPIQVIATGNDFMSQPDVNRIELRNVWR